MKDYSKDIQSAYKHIQELLHKKPGHEKTLNALIALEDIVDKQVFSVLENKYGKNLEYSTIKQTFQHSPRWRNSSGVRGN